MSKRPTFCEQAEFASAFEATKHYEERGFAVWDRDDGWLLMRRGALEAYIRANKARTEWIGTVVQMECAQ